jgi:hypothetical protein
MESRPEALHKQMVKAQESKLELQLSLERNSMSFRVHVSEEELKETRGKIYGMEKERVS